MYSLYSLWFAFLKRLLINNDHSYISESLVSGQLQLTRLGLDMKSIVLQLSQLVRLFLITETLTRASGKTWDLDKNDLTLESLEGHLEEEQEEHFIVNLIQF